MILLQIIQPQRDKSMHNKKRASEIKDFLGRQSGLKNYRLESMGFDASSRKYFRVFLSDGATKILVDDEGCYNRPKEFAELSRFLLKNKIKAPKVFEKNLRKGLLLVEDFGDSDFVKKADGKNDKELLRKAVDVLVKLHKVNECPSCVEVMDGKVILDNFALFTDWYVPACLGRQLTAEQRESFFKIVKRLMPAALKLPSNLVLWDYHVNNVMYPDSVDEAAIIDFQDAMWGPGLYDLASLIEDERRDIPAVTAKELKEYYFSRMGCLNRKDFETAYAYMALLRHMRVLGRFTTLILVRKRPWYEKYIPHGLELLKQSLENPLFKDLKKWIAENFNESQWGFPKDKQIDKAFVLAAGRGTRMRHLTEKCAKPMIKVNGRALIDYGFDLLKNAKIKDVVVNVCYRKGTVKRHVQSLKGFNVVVSEEKEALETGGGIKKALKFFENKPFIVVNADNILIDDGYKPVVRQMQDIWDDEKHDILLLLRDIKGIYGDRPAKGDYKITEAGIERNKEKICGGGYDYGYVGVAIIHPRIFAGAPRGKFSLVELFDKAESSGRLGYAVSDRREFWVGSPEAVEETEKMLAV